MREGSSPSNIQRERKVLPGISSQMINVPIGTLWLVLVENEVVTKNDMESRSVKLPKSSPNTLRRVMPRVCDVPELYLGCQDLEDLLLVSVAQLIHSTARVQAPNIVRESVDTSFRAYI